MAPKFQVLTLLSIPIYNLSRNQFIVSVGYIPTLVSHSFFETLDLFYLKMNSAVGFTPQMKLLV